MLHFLIVFAIIIPFKGFIKKHDTDVKMASERLLRKFSGRKLLSKSFDTEEIGSEGEKAGYSSKHKRYASGDGDTNDFEFDNSETESSGEPFSSPVSEIRWSGTSLADTRSFDAVVTTDEKKGTNEQNGGGLSTAFVAVLVFGGLFFLMLMITFFVFAW